MYLVLKTLFSGACPYLPNNASASRAVSWSLPLPVSEIQGCGFSSKEETGIVKSQNWPMNYKANAECMWNIAVPAGKNITLTFTHFDLEGKEFLTPNCYDNVMVYDINGATNALILDYGKLVELLHDWLKPKQLIILKSNTSPSHEFILILTNKTVYLHCYSECIYTSTCKAAMSLYVLSTNCFFNTF